MQKSEAIKHFGGVKKLAEAVGRSRQAIHAWGDTVPDLYQYKLHQLTQGELPLDERLALPPEGSRPQ